MSKSRLQRSSDLVDVDISEEALNRAVALFLAISIRALLSKSKTSSLRSEDEWKRVSRQSAS